MNQPTENTAPPPSRNPVRRLYDWMLSWADHPNGTRALAVITFAESSFFPIPPDPLLLALCLGKPKKSFVFATVATVSSVLGGLFGYMIGALLWSVVGDFFFAYVPGVTPEAFARVQEWYHQWGFWAVFLGGVTPLPYKVFTLASGMFGIAIPAFIIASAVSRGLRFYAEAALVYFYGPPIGTFIDRHFNKLAWAFGILLVLGFVAIGML